jgi:UDP-glucose 4-epimerase
MKKKILISGGCGFIGINLVKYLLSKKDYQILILDNLSTGNKEYLKIVAHEREIEVLEEDKDEDKPYIRLIIGDIIDQKICLKACREVYAVIHLAACAGVIPSIKNPFFDFKVNVLGTLNLLHAAVINKVEKFIFASSNAPMGNQLPPLNESKIPKPISPYGASKLAGEGYCSAFYGSYGLKTAVLRFSNVYGPFSLHKDSVIAKFIKDAIIEGVLTIYGDGTQTRDFIYVDDLCRIISKVLETEVPDAIFGEIFHLGTGIETSIISLAEYVRTLIGNGTKIIFGPKRKGEIKRNYSNIDKARSLLEFQPEFSLEDGVKKVYEWFVEQGKEKILESKVLSGSE